MAQRTKPGVPLPFGASEVQDGVNFSLFSEHATHVRLEFFAKNSDMTPIEFFDLDPQVNRTGDVWHIWIKNVPSGQLYAYRVDGPNEPANGHRFDFNKLLLDPCALAIAPLPNWDFSSDVMPKCVFVKDIFDWGDDKQPMHSWANTVIYETHVRGLTMHSSSKTKYPGTFQGLIDKIPYFQELGITAVELMPVFEFAPVTNYWGYNPVSFFAPKASYSSAGGLGQQVFEFKKMVCALHKANIEVILDVVFNHTAEGNEHGPVLCFKGIDNSVYYILEQDKQHYKDFTGTGNTINANHPMVKEHILSSLRYWVMHMHVDGFRFDLAPILDLDESGNLLKIPSLLESIAQDPILRDVKLIAEAWGAVSGLYQVGHFSVLRWAEWNGHYRDDVRRFWRGDDYVLGAFASRLSGSSDVYSNSGKTPENSINFISCHDGFTLNDLVSYGEKHNEANRQGNKDGADENFSANYGVEGVTNDQTIESLRKRQIKNFLLTLFVSRGVPMLLGGDEFRRTQQGNNNAYCQDNETSWYNWDYLKQHADIYNFTKMLISFRKAHPILSTEQFYTDTQIKWFNPQGFVPNWHDPSLKKLACLIFEDKKNLLYILFNAGNEASDFVLPHLPQNHHWQLVIDTAHDAVQTSGRLDDLKTYHLEAHASAILSYFHL